jgi:uncharacterized membrane protein (Fun14 family)
MQRISDYLSRLLRIGQGAQWLWTVGGGTVVAAVLAGLVAVYAALPWWSVVGILVGAFLLAAATIRWAGDRMRRRSPLTPIIERALQLRERLVADPSEPDVLRGKASEQWRLRIDDWTSDAREVVKRVSPQREPAFMLDLIVADTPYGANLGLIAGWKVELLLDLDIRVERLIVMRATL